MRREPKDIDELRDIVRPRDYRVFAGRHRAQRWPLASRILYHLFGGRLGDNRDWGDIDAWAQSIATALGASARTSRARSAATRPDSCNAAQALPLGRAGRLPGGSPRAGADRRACRRVGLASLTRLADVVMAGWPFGG